MQLNKETDIKYWEWSSLHNFDVSGTVFTPLNLLFPTFNQSEQRPSGTDNTPIKSTRNLGGKISATEKSKRS